MVSKEVLPPYPQVINSITETHQDQLLSTLRYARFIQGETPEEWASLLGPDVVNLTHPDVVADITQRFISFNQKKGITLSDEELTLLSTAPWIHDWGELIIDGIGVGDVTFERKTNTHEDTELQIFDLVLKEIDDDEVRDVMKKTYTDVVLNRDNKLGRMFNAIERIGYVETAVQAFIGVEGKRITNWRGLVGNVLSNQIEKLLAYKTEYPYVDEILKLNEGTIDQMITIVLEENVPIDNEGNASYDLTKLQKAKTAWSQRNNE